MHHMSMEEIRANKAMALLERQEAKEQWNLLDKRRKEISSKLKSWSFADKVIGSTREVVQGGAEYISLCESAIEVCHELEIADGKLFEAEQRCKQFGL